MIKNSSVIRILSVFTFIFAVMVFSVQIHADEFEDMMAGEMDAFDSQKSEFQTYKEQVQSEFETYKKIVDEEFNRYRSSILKHWDKPEMSDKKVFVEYSPDFKTKKKVDFENETIEISIIIPKDEPQKSVDKKIDQQLTDLVTENSKTAFQRDQLAQNIEKKLDKQVKELKTATVKAVPIITEVVTGTVKPTVEKVEKAVEKLRETEKTIKKPAPKTDDAEIVTVKIKLPSGSMSKKATVYVNTVKKFAAKRKLDPALVMAVMQTESAFNPMAKSYIPAYGLMQIVPRSAGLDASELVYGKQKILSPSYLYNGDNNIKMGAAYLYILNYRYLKSIKNDTSRLYCVIAAYNTGAGNVARAFTGRTNISKAAKKINNMTPDQVYNHLIRKLPHAETKHYVKNVTKRMKLYR